MFYSETLLAKTGPLAKVWLAANVERKLTKGDCLKQNIEKDVQNIVDTNQAPLALRLTSQLLLGVVRIYSRKARYLLDDCNEALLKIKLAFRPGNVDLPSTQSHTANPATLMLPDTITELDLFAPMPGPEELLFGISGQDQTTLDWGTSQMLPASFDTGRKSQSQTLQLDDDDLGLDLGEDIVTPGIADRSIEVGRRAEPARRDESMLYEDDLGLELDLGEPTIREIVAGGDDTVLPPIDDDDLPMGGIDINIEESNTTALARAEERQRERDSESPLSSIGPEEERELEQTFQLDHQTELEEANATEVQAQQRVKRRKVLQNDVNTEIPNTEIRRQQEDRSKILKAPSFLPRDPMLLALMNMQKSGGFVSSILGDGRSLGWAPELRGVLSLEVVRRAGELKRKRDSGVADLEIPSDEEEHPAEPTPAPEDEEVADAAMAGADDDLPIFPGSDGLEPPAAGASPRFDDEDEQDVASPGGPAFDETTMPILHPADSGPVSLGTKHTVHLLREHFSIAAGNAADSTTPPSPNSRAAQSVLFTDLCPEARTSRQDATKLFFETLVLGTKDAIKVEQSSDVLGAPIRIRGKRGLWGDWAEMGVVSQSQGVPSGTQVLAAGGE